VDLGDFFAVSFILSNALNRGFAEIGKLLLLPRRVINITDAPIVAKHAIDDFIADLHHVRHHILLLNSDRTLPVCRHMLSVKTAEETLLSLNAFLEHNVEVRTAELTAILATIPQAIVFIDDGGDRAWVNAQSAEPLGVSLEQHEPSVIAGAIARLVTSAVNAAEIASTESRLVSKPDQRIRDWIWFYGEPVTRILSVASSPTTFSTIRGRLWVFTDVTVIHLANEQLKKINATKDKLFSIIAHDLRGPVGNLRQGLELITGSDRVDQSFKAKVLEEI